VWGWATESVAHTEGLLRLRFAQDSRGRTYLASREQKFPLHLTNPLYLDATLPGMAFVYVQNPSGGVFGGDRLSIEVVAGAGTEVHLTSTAATKAYRSESGEAVEDVMLTLGRDAYLEYLPEPLIPQAGSRLRQHVTVDLDDGAAFLMADVVSPGRAARGEMFAFEELERRTIVRRDGAEVAVDALHLEPGLWSPRKRGVFGTHAYLASLIVVASQAKSVQWRERISDAVDHLPGVLAGSGALPGDVGMVIRILSRSLIAATSSVEGLWGFIRSGLAKGVAPRRRK
jgi:urease accessory protein